VAPVPLEEPIRTTGGIRVPPPQRRLGRRLAMILVPLLTLLTGAAVAGVVVQGIVGHGRQAPAVAAETHDRTTYTLDSADYVGRPVDEVAMQLAALGLSVVRHADADALAPAGTVTAVSPTDRKLRPGDVVTLTYAIGRAGTPSAGSGPDRRTSRETTADGAAPTSVVPAAVNGAAGSSSAGNGAGSSRTTTPTTSPTTSTTTATESTTTSPTTTASSSTASGTTTP
jgi:serine/threonine-protein kinase